MKDLFLPGPRREVTFRSGADECSAWFYPGTRGSCVVMATGAAVTKGPGADRFARRFQEAGHAVLTFDYRRFGRSGGRPRQVLRVRDQLDDLRAAVRCAATLPGVDPDRLVLWGFSLGGGHVLGVAAELPIAAAIAQTPLADGWASGPQALRHETLGVILRFPLIALADWLGGLLGRAPRLVPLSGPRGAVAMLTTPDAQDGAHALDPDGIHADWTQAIAARSVMPLAFYRPGRRAASLQRPLLVVVADEDESVLAGPALDAANRAPAAEVLRVTGGHYAPFLGEFERVVDAELAFLDAHVGSREPAL